MFLIAEFVRVPPAAATAKRLRRRDEQTIADLYRSNGFRDVKVKSRTRWTITAGKEGDLAVFFTIAEGTQYTVASLKIEGATKLDLCEDGRIAQFADGPDLQRIQHRGRPRNDHAAVRRQRFRQRHLRVGFEARPGAPQGRTHVHHP